MNEGLETSFATRPPERKRFPRALIALAVLSLALIGWLYISAPVRDPRLVGEWQSDNGLVRIFHADGRLEVLTLPARKAAFPGGQRWWRTEGDELVTGTQTIPSRFKNWFQNLFSSRTGVAVIGLNDSRYRILDLTQTRLELLLLREPTRPGFPTEVFERISTSPPLQSHSARAP